MDLYISCLSFWFDSAYMKVRLIWQSSSNRSYIWGSVTASLASRNRFFTVVQMQAKLRVMRRQSKGHHLKLTIRHFVRARLPTDCPDWTWKDKVHVFENFVYLLDACVLWNNVLLCSVPHAVSIFGFENSFIDAFIRRKMEFANFWVGRSFYSTDIVLIVGAKF